MMIRNFRSSDTNDIVAVLKLNNQYSHPNVDGPEAMKRVAACESSVFLVCETEEKVVDLSEVSMMVQGLSSTYCLFIPIIRVTELAQHLLKK